MCRSLSPFAAPFSLEPSLPTGMVLLRSYLSVPQQVALVSELMALGKGPGGFLTPRHRGGGRLHLRMMCLGGCRQDALFLEVHRRGWGGS